METFCAALALTNAAALTNWAVQWRGLIGERGITPAAGFVNKALQRAATQRASASASRSAGQEPGEDNSAEPGYLAQAAARLQQLGQRLYRWPSVFMVTGGSDTAIMAVFGVGYAALAALALGWAPWAAAATFAAVYLSFLTVSQPWLSLQMDANLVETNAIFALTAAFAWAAPSAWVWAQRWLVFRVMVGCGAGKWSGGDATWRDMTAMAYHYETQPLPNALSRVAHRAPAAFHRWETRLTYLVECGVPLLYLGGPAARWIGFVITAGFNLMIGITGNYGHLHLLTITEALALVVETDCGAPAAAAWLPKLAVHCTAAGAAGSGGSSLLMLAATLAGWLCAWAIVAGYAAVTFVPLARTFHDVVELKIGPAPVWPALVDLQARLSHFRLANYYSKFSHMTRTRWELQLEGTADGGATWHAFGYVAKPGGDAASLDAQPRTLLPGYRPTLDWRSWFVPLDVYRALKRGMQPTDVPVEAWYRAFEEKVLAGEPSVLALLRVPPALAAAASAGRPLTGVRTLIYDYRFSEGARSASMQVNGGTPSSGGLDQQQGRRVGAVSDGGPPTSASSGGEPVPLPSSASRRGQSSAEAEEEPRYGFRAGGSAAPTHAHGVLSIVAAAPLAGELYDPAVWREGLWWRRRFVCEYDSLLAQARRGSVGSTGGDAPATDETSAAVRSATSAGAAAGARRRRPSRAKAAAAPPAATRASRRVQPDDVDED
jgi:hypothetical protein